MEGSPVTRADDERWQENLPPVVVTAGIGDRPISTVIEGQLKVTGNRVYVGEEDDDVLEGSIEE